MQATKSSLVFPLFLVFYEIATYLSNDMYLPSLPTLTVDLNTTQEVAQNTLLYWFLGSASMQLLMGPLSDRFGRRIILLSGGVLYIIATFIIAITDNITLMLATRFIQGCCICSVVVPGYAAIHELYESRRAIQIIAIMGGVTILAPALGPLLGAIIIELSHWRVIFIVLGIWAFIAVAALFIVMPETNPERIKLNLEAIFRDYLKISGRLPFLGFTLPLCLLFVSEIAWLVESPFIIMDIYGKSVMEFGWIQMIVFGGFIAGSQLVNALAHRVKPLYLIEWGLGISFVSGLLLLCNTFFSGHLYWVVMMMALLSGGAGLAFGPLNRSAIETCQEPMGRVIAVFMSFMALFSALATFLTKMYSHNQINKLCLLIACGSILGFVIFFSAKKCKVFTGCNTE